MRDHSVPSQTVPTATPDGTSTVGKTTLADGAQGDAAPRALVSEIQRAALEGNGRRAVALLSRASAPVQGDIIDAIGERPRRGLARSMPRDIGDSAAGRAIAAVVFQHIPDAELPALRALFEARFRLDVDEEGGARDHVDAMGLRRLWQVFQVLPPEHVAHNWAVARVDRYTEQVDTDPDHVRGSFGGELQAGQISMSYIDKNIQDGGTTDHDVEGDALHGVHRFDEVARHEVGHAVDRELGQPSLTLVATSEAGRWTEYKTDDEYATAARELLRLTPGPLAQYGDRARVVAAIAQAMKLSDPASIDALVGGDRELAADPIVAVLRGNLATSDPWKRDDAIGGRHFHETYTGRSWVSYDEAARGRRVSEYQFRAPGEWFAECYAAFYSPEPGQPRGSRLLRTLPATHAWFVAHVDNRADVRRQSETTRTYDGAPRKR